MDAAFIRHTEEDINLTELLATIHKRPKSQDMIFTTLEANARAIMIDIETTDRILREGLIDSQCDVAIGARCLNRIRREQLKHILEWARKVGVLDRMKLLDEV